MKRINKEKDSFFPQDPSFFANRSLGEKGSTGYTLSPYEVLFAMEKYTVKVMERERELSFRELYREINKIYYAIYKDLKNSGYIVKSGLKYGFVFRVYKKGDKPGKNHSQWLVWPLHMEDNFYTLDFVAKNRVAHGVRKKVLLGVVDDEENIVYYEAGWRRV